MPTIFPTQKNDPELYSVRSGLVFGFFNALTWQVAIGTPMVLFAEQLGATPLQVGLAYSFVFTLTPIQILSTALLPKYGFRKVMLSGWGTRSIFLSIPLVLLFLAPGGVEGWMVHALVWSVFFFCFCRSVGAASFVPWMYALLPEGARGKYFSSDQYVSGIGGVITLIACAALFAFLPIYTALIVQYSIALVGSTLSYFALAKLPDTEKPTAISLGSVLRDTPRHMLKPSIFRTYLWLAVLFAVISTPLSPFAAYYLKAVPKLPASQIMGFEVCRFLGVIVVAAFMKSRVDRFGAKPFLVASAALHVAVAIYWWCYLRFDWHMLWPFYGLYFFVGFAASAWTSANLGYLPKITPEAERTLMVSVQTAVTACIGGFSPVVWGMFLKNGEGSAIDVPIFQLFFISVLVGGVFLTWRVSKLPEKTDVPVQPLFIGSASAILRPLRAASYLINLVEPPRKKPDGR
jgi:MFS family permease